MPDRALWWDATLPDHHRIWSDVSGLVSESESPVVVSDGNYLAPYGALVRQGANLVPRVYLTVEDQPPSPLGVPSSKRAIQSRRSRDEREPWKDLPGVKGTVEQRFCFPVVLGESVVPYRIRSTLTTVIPHDGQELLERNGEIDSYPGLAEWWRTVSRRFDRNKSDSTDLDLNGQINFQSKLTNQFPLKAERVAYTGRGSKTCAARIEDPRTIIDHALYWLPVESPAEGRYLCAVLNSRALGEKVEEGFSKGQFGKRNIHRAPFRLYFGEYDPADELHRGIAASASRAVEVAHAVDLSDVRQTAAARRRVRKALAESGVTDELEDLVLRLLDREAPREESS
jgi:hypothetical protein